MNHAGNKCLPRYWSIPDPRSHQERDIAYRRDCLQLQTTSSSHTFVQYQHAPSSCHFSERTYILPMNISTNCNIEFSEKLVCYDNTRTGDWCINLQHIGFSPEHFCAFLQNPQSLLLAYTTLPVEVIFQKCDIWFRAVLSMSIEELFWRWNLHSRCLYLCPRLNCCTESYIVRIHTSLTTRSWVLITFPSSNVCCVKSMSGIGTLTWICSIALAMCVLMAPEFLKRAVKI